MFANEPDTHLANMKGTLRQPEIYLFQAYRKIKGKSINEKHCPS